MVLGSVGYSSGVHTWEIEVGNSHNWSLGVCFGSAERSLVQMVNPANPCFWGIRRNGEVYSFLNTSLVFMMQTHPRVVRVRLEDCFSKKEGWRRNVSYFHGDCNCLFAMDSHLPAGMALYPFVIPEKRSSPLRFLPATVTVTTEHAEQEKSFLERHKIPLCLLAGFLFLLLCVYLIY